MRKPKVDMLTTADVLLHLFIYKDEFGYYSAYCPALHLAGQGKSESLAIQSFHQMVKIFFDETIRKGTLEDSLKELGWKKKTKGNLKPPALAKSDIPSYLFSHKEVLDAGSWACHEVAAKRSTS